MAVAGTGSGSDPRLSFRASFEKAITSVKNPNEHLNTDTDDDDPDDGAADDDLEDLDADAAGDDDPEDEADPDDDAEPDVDAKADKKETEKPAAKAKAGKGDEDEPLVTDDEFAKLQAKHKDDPAALRKELVKVFTQKTQALAQKRASTERLLNYQPLIDRLENPATREETILELAKHNGIDLSKAAKGKKGDEAADAPTAEEQTAEFLADLKKDMGPDLEYLADTMAPAFMKFAEKLIARNIKGAVSPLEQSTRGLLDKVANEQTDAIMDAFHEKYPDWEEYDEAMTALSEEITPTKKMTAFQYLEKLYKLASRDAWEANKDQNVEKAADDKTKKRVAKLTRNAADAEPTRRAVPENQVRKRPAGPVSWKQAREAALRGETFDDDDSDDD